MDLSLTQLTFRDFVPESLRNDYLEGKCKEIGKIFKLGCVFPMVILFEFGMGKQRDEDHREDAPHFSIFSKLGVFIQKSNQTRAFIMLTVLY